MKDQPAPGVTTAPAEWVDVESLFSLPGEPSRCWCRYFALTGPEYSALEPAARKAQLQAKFDGDSPSPGVLAFRGGQPVGWCAVEPRTCFPRVLRSRVLRLAETPTPAEGGATDPGRAGRVWSVTCFVVAPGHRRSGVAEVLLRAAVDHARAHGADVVEGYPVDRTLRPKAGAADLYHGTLNLFLRAGFQAVSSAVPGRAVVRLDLRGGAAGPVP
jgi:GNAT superfamily N-acetyltransferase